MATKQKKYVWNDALFVKAHRLSRSGLTHDQVGHALGVPRGVWRGWVKAKPALREALESAKSKPAAGELAVTGESFADYVFGRLSPELQELWKRIEAIDEEADQGPDAANAGPRSFTRQFRPDAIDRLFQTSGIQKARQSLWVHALFASNFNANEACRRVNVSRQAVDKWRREDPDFDSLVRDGIREAKKDFGEACLMRMMAAGDSACIIYFAKTQLADRGYAQTKQVQHSGQVNVLRQSVEVNLDNVPLDQRRAVLDALRQSRGPAALPPKEVGDAPGQ